jgi:hypothetical protein
MNYYKPNENVLQRTIDSSQGEANVYLQPTAEQSRIIFIYLGTSTSTLFGLRFQVFVNRLKKPECLKFNKSFNTLLDSWTEHLVVSL